ncbi:hypothetical protein H0H92_015065, partial [Tricholoma furcatifolium]
LSAREPKGPLQPTSGYTRHDAPYEFDIKSHASPVFVVAHFWHTCVEAKINPLEEMPLLWSNRYSQLLERIKDMYRLGDTMANTCPPEKFRTATDDEIEELKKKEYDYRTKVSPADQKDKLPTTDTEDNSIPEEPVKPKRRRGQGKKPGAKRAKLTKVPTA